MLGAVVVTVATAVSLLPVYTAAVLAVLAATRLTGVLEVL
jgi:hypothetical protein